MASAPVSSTRNSIKYCLDNISHNPEELTKISRMELVEKAGAQGTEFLMWMMMRGALGDNVTELTRNYHIPDFEYGCWHASS